MNASSNEAAARALVVVATVAAGAGCTKPDPPTITPERSTVTKVDAQGLTLAVTLRADNPNAFALSGESVAASVTLDGNVPLGQFSQPNGFSIPAKGSSSITVPVALGWSHFPELAGAAMKPQIPYLVDGTVTVGGSSLHVDVPFRIQGTMTQAELLRAIPSIRGLPAFKP